MSDTYTAVCKMIDAFESYVLDREIGSAGFLLHDEIAEILREAPNGSLIEIWDFPDCRESYTVHRTSRRTTFRTFSGQEVSARDMVYIIYDEIEANGYVTIDGNDILTY